MCIPVHGQIGKGARSFRHRLLGTGDRDEPAGRPISQHPTENKNFLCTDVYAKRDSFVDLAYLHKRDLQGNTLSYRRRKTGRALTVSLTPEAMQMVRMIANKDKDSPYLFPILQSEEGTEAAYREYQAALRAFNQRLAVLRQCLGMQSALSSYAARHTWATMAYHCEIHPGIISEAMGHSSITVTETYLKPFSNRKIDEANQKVISFVKTKDIQYKRDYFF